VFRSSDVVSHAQPTDNDGHVILVVRETGVVDVDDCRYVADGGRNVVSRLIWLVFVLGGIALALFQIQERIIYYWQNPTATNIVLVDAPAIRFPQVTVCNENKAMRSIADQYGIQRATAHRIYRQLFLYSAVVTEFGDLQNNGISL